MDINEAERVKLTRLKNYKMQMLYDDSDALQKFKTSNIDVTFTNKMLISFIFYISTGFSAMGDILTVHDAAKRFGFSTKYIYAKIQEGELKSLRKHGTTFIDTDDLLPSPHISENEDHTVPKDPPPSNPLNDSLEELRLQIDELKSETQEKDPKNNMLTEYLETVVKEQKQQIAKLQLEPRGAPANQEMIDYLQNVVTQQRQQITDLQNKLDHSQKEVILAIKDANNKKDDQLKQYIEFLNNSTKELINTLEHKPGVPAEEKSFTTAAKSDDVVDIDVEIAKDPVRMKVIDFLKAKGIAKKERKRLKAVFLSALLNDQKRFITVDDELYIYPYEYSYNDLLKSSWTGQH